MPGIVLNACFNCTISFYSYTCHAGKDCLSAHFTSNESAVGVIPRFFYCWGNWDTDLAVCSRSQAEIGIWVSQRSLFPWTCQKMDHLTVGHLSCVWPFCDHIDCIDRQAPLSMGPSRQEYWSGLQFPPPRDLPHPGIKPTSPILAGKFFTTEPPGRPFISLKVKVAQSCPTLCDPMDYTVHGILQARIMELGSLSLLQGIFPTQGSNPDLQHCRQILYQLSHQGSPRLLEWVAYPFSRGSSQPRNQTGSPALQADSLPTELSGKPSFRASSHWVLLKTYFLKVVFLGLRGIWGKPSKFGKLSSGHRTGKVSFNSNPKERQCQRMLKLLHSCTHLTR